MHVRELAFGYSIPMLFALRTHCDVHWPALCERLYIKVKPSQPNIVEIVEMRESRRFRLESATTIEISLNHGDFDSSAPCHRRQTIHFTRINRARGWQRSHRKKQYRLSHGRLCVSRNFRSHFVICATIQSAVCSRMHMTHVYRFRIDVIPSRSFHRQFVVL